MMKIVKKYLKNMKNKLNHWFKEDKTNTTSKANYIKAGSIALVLIATVSVGNYWNKINKLSERTTDNNVLSLKQEESNLANVDEITLYDRSLNRSSDELEQTIDTIFKNPEDILMQDLVKKEVSIYDNTNLESKEITNSTTTSTSIKEKNNTSHSKADAKSVNEKESTTSTTQAETTTTSATTTKTSSTKASTTKVPTTIKVQKGEGWWHLGNRTGIDFRYLAVFNGKMWTDPVYTGQSYKIPSKEELAKVKLPKVTTKSTTRSTTKRKATKPSSPKVSGNLNSPLVYTLNQFLFKGRINWQGKQYTYYSQRVLPGKGLRIPGRHVSAAGYVVDGNGYIVLASDAYPKGTVVATPFGAPGKVYDAFGTGQGSHRFDVYIR